MTESNKDSTKDRTPPPSYIHLSPSTSKVHPYHNIRSNDPHRKLLLATIVVPLTALTLFATLLALSSAQSHARPPIFPTTVTFLCLSTLLISAIPLGLVAYISFLKWPNVDEQMAYEQFLEDGEPELPRSGTVALREVRQQLLSSYHFLYTVLFLLLLYAVMLVIQATILYKAVCKSGIRILMVGWS